MECNGEQIRYAAQSFAELCHLFAEQLIKVVLTKNPEYMEVIKTPLSDLPRPFKIFCKD